MPRLKRFQAKWEPVRRPETRPDSNQEAARCRV